MSQEIIKGIAEILWASAWADHAEEHGCYNLSGCEITEHMPEPIPPGAGRPDLESRMSTTPLLDSLLFAIEIAKVARAAYDACECASGDDGNHNVCEHWRASVAADRAVEVARAAVRASDEPRDWILREEGHDYDTVTAEGASEAIDIARSNVDRGNYPVDEDGPGGTIWVDVSVRCEETGEEDCATVQCDPEEPKCSDGEHDWQSPHEILGGLKDNPGVWGHGGGVILRRVCMHCGCERVTDTWAQRPDTGQQGLESVRYEPGKYADEVRALRDEEA